MFQELARELIGRASETDGHDDHVKTGVTLGSVGGVFGSVHRLQINVVTLPARDMP